jgi:hypothetical protein
MKEGKEQSEIIDLASKATDVAEKGLSLDGAMSLSLHLFYLSL